METKNADKKPVRFYIQKNVHLAIKTHCVRHGENLQDWLEVAVMAAYKNEIECKGGDNER